MTDTMSSPAGPSPARPGPSGSPSSPPSAPPSSGTARTPPWPTEQPEARSSGDAVAQVRDLGTELLIALRDSATALLNEQRARIATEIEVLGEVLHRSLQSLDRTEGAPYRDGAIVAGYADQLARQISELGDRLRGRSLEELSGDIENFAARWPLWFIASAIGVGVIAGRLLAASAKRPEPEEPSHASPPRVDRAAGGFNPRGGQSDGAPVSGGESE